MYLELIWNTKIMCSKEGRRLTYLYFLFLISFLYKYIHLFLDIKKLVFFFGYYFYMEHLLDGSYNHRKQ